MVGYSNGLAEGMADGKELEGAVEGSSNSLAEG